MIRDCNCEVGLNVKCVFRKSKHKIMQSNAGKIVYILTVLQLWLPDNEIFSLHANFGCSYPRVWRKLTLFPHGKRPTYRKLYWRLCRWHSSQTWKQRHQYVYVSRLLRVHTFNNNADTSIRCLIARTVQLGWSSIQSAFLLFPLNSGASIHCALSNLLSGYSSTRLLHHLNTRKRT